MIEIDSVRFVERSPPPYSPGCISGNKRTVLALTFSTVLVCIIAPDEYDYDDLHHTYAVHEYQIIMER